MAEFTPPKHGTIAWRELQTKDLAAAKSFYKDLLGWELPQSPFAPVEYPQIVVDGVALGGMLEINETWGEGWENIPANWSTYIAVDDCDAAFEAVKANGGTTYCAPFDAPNVGRVCIVADPSGAHFSIIQFVRS